MLTGYCIHLLKFDVSEYFDDCCDEIGTELDAAGIELNYRNHIKEPVIIAADPEQLKRVINNIISNSVKYMAEGRKGKIDIDLYDESDYVHIIIADNGKGIAGKDVSHILKGSIELMSRVTRNKEEAA